MRHDEGIGMPRFVAQELRRFLGCEVLAHGFAGVRCDACGFERFVPFGCKGRGFYPSCGGRRMAERAAHLTDRVLPAAPLRQWVLTVPHRLRYLDDQMALELLDSGPYHPDGQPIGRTTLRKLLERRFSDAGPPCPL